MNNQTRSKIAAALRSAAAKLMAADSVIPEPGLKRAIFEIDISDISKTRCVIAWSYDSKLIMGIATWDDSRGQLEFVKVDEEFRRQGVGSALYKAAVKLHGGPLKDTGERSAQGTALIKSLGVNPEKLKRSITGREVESIGAMLMSNLYGMIRRNELDSRVKNGPIPF